MNFYILTFKKKIFISLGLVCLLMVLIDLSLIYVINKKTTKTTFSDLKSSKIKHFEFNHSLNKDIVFVGSSRTFYQISTNTFLKNNINVYNFGISGLQLADYPSIIKSVIKYKPKKVIISLRVNTIYMDLGLPKSPFLEDLSYYYSINKMLFFKVLIKYIIHFHTLLQYSEELHYKFNAFYEKFNFSNKHNLNSISIQPTSNMVNHKDKLNVMNLEYYSNLTGSKVFDLAKIYPKIIALKCTNGDGILIGTDHVDAQKLVNYTLSKLNIESINYLKKMFDKLESNGISTTLILEPILENKYSYDLDLIKKSFQNTNIIDLTNYKLEKTKWADSGHLNFNGREAYSHYLLSLYKKNFFNM